MPEFHKIKIEGMWMPAAWYKDPWWICDAGHVSNHVLKSEALGRDACLWCGGQLTGLITVAHIMQMDKNNA